MAVTERQGFLARLLPASGAGVFFELFEQHADRTREAARLLAAMFREGASAEQQAGALRSAESLAAAEAVEVDAHLGVQTEVFDGRDAGRVVE